MFGFCLQIPAIYTGNGTKLFKEAMLEYEHVPSNYRVILLFYGTTKQNHLILDKQRKKKVK